LDNALLASITVNRIKFVYVPIGIFNNPKLVKTASEYAEKIKKYYQSFGYNIDFDYVKITDKEFDIVSKLKKSHIIYLSGGDTKFLAAKLKSRLILQALRGAYTRNAVIIGNSAGILSLLERYLFPMVPPPSL
jgi:peptidase E